MRTCHECGSNYEGEAFVLEEKPDLPPRIYSLGVDGLGEHVLGVKLICQKCANVRLGRQATLTEGLETQWKDGG